MCTHEFSSTHINLPCDLVDKIVHWGETNVTEADLYRNGDITAFGREKESHVTILYGIHTTSANRIKRLLAGEKQFKIELGKISLFKENNKFDVVKIEVQSPELYRLNRYFKESLEYSNQFLIYKPHVTIAYINKNSKDSLQNAEYFLGSSFMAKQIIFSSRLGDKTPIPLNSF